MTDLRLILAEENDDASIHPAHRVAGSPAFRAVPSPLLSPQDGANVPRRGPGLEPGAGWVAINRPPPLALWAVTTGESPSPTIAPSRPWSQASPQSSGTKRSGPVGPLMAQAYKRRREDETELGIPSSPPMPHFLTQAPDICKYAPGSTPPAETETARNLWDMKLVTLTSSSNLQTWTDQVEAIAREVQCYGELITHSTTFPAPGPVKAIAYKARLAACWTILRDSIAGPIWAYMRILGYRRIPVFKGPDGFQWQPSPSDCFYFAKEAFKRIDRTRSPNQSRREIIDMVEEAQMATAADYPTNKQFAEGKDWIMSVLNQRIREGDRETCEALYDYKPTWAPEWPTRFPIQQSSRTVPLPTQPAQSRNPGPSIEPMTPLSLALAAMPVLSPTMSSPTSTRYDPANNSAPPSVMPRPSSAPGSDHFPLPVAIPRNRRSSSGVDMMPLPPYVNPRMGAALPVIQPRPGPIAAPESPTQQGSGSTPLPPTTPTFPGFHSTLEWSPSLTQEKMRNATWKELNVKVPTVRSFALREDNEGEGAAVEPTYGSPTSSVVSALQAHSATLASQAGSAAPVLQPSDAMDDVYIAMDTAQAKAATFRRILPSASKPPRPDGSTPKGAAGFDATTQPPRKGYRFVHEVKRSKPDVEE